MSRFSEFDYKDGLNGLPQRPFIDEDGKRAYEAGERARLANQDLADRVREANEEFENRQREAENEAEDARIQAIVWASYTPEERAREQARIAKIRKDDRDREEHLRNHPLPPPRCKECDEGFALEAFLLAFPWTIVLSPVWLIVYFSMSTHSSGMFDRTWSIYFRFC
jgi:hypothetical protein